MSVRLVSAEIRKAISLPAVWVAFLVGVGGTVALALLNAFRVRDAVRSGRPDLVGYTDAAQAVFSAVPIGAVGAVIVGVVVVSHEYTAAPGRVRQILTTLLAAPGRTRVLPAKAAAVTVIVFGASAISLVVAHALAGLVVDGQATASADTVLRSAGAGLYSVLTALMAMAVTVLTRGGIVPLVVFIVNSSLVSVSFLLAQVTSLALYLPDLAGTALFAGDLMELDGRLGPWAGGLVMAGWTAVLLAVAATVFARRDA